MMSIATEPPVEVEQAPLDSLYEVIDGLRVEKPPMAMDAVLVTAALDQLLGAFARANRLGRVVPEMLFHLGAGRPQRRPDVAFVSYERWPRERKSSPVAAWEVVPDLAIEVISPTNQASAMRRKVREYFEAGVRRVWVVYPEDHSIDVYDSPRLARIFGPGDHLDGEDILPGFRLPVAELFEDVVGPAE
jgi:Uma2 family endonuclease